MDVDDNSESTDATIQDEEVASSSNLATNAVENRTSTDDKKIIASTSKVTTASSDPEVEACSESITGAVEENSYAQTNDNLQESQLQHANVPVSENFDEEEQQNEQHIENAGINPNYPLVLVRRVSIPSPTDNSVETLEENDNEDAAGMNQDINEERGEGIALRIPSHADVMAMFNTISAAASEDEDDDDDENVGNPWSDEDEEGIAFYENHNFGGFTTQVEAMRHMIAQTRRNMAEAEANFGPMPRNTIMQRFRRILFILNNRRRRLIRLGLARSDFALPASAAIAEMETENDNSESYNAETGENTPNEAAGISIEQEEEMNANAVRFDTNLPAEHSYMGENMNRVSGVNYLEAGQYIKLRLFIHHHILFPGEVLPFMVNSSTNIIEGDIDSQNGILFGVCFPCLTNNMEVRGSVAFDRDGVLYGITCQIYELGEDNRSNTLIKSRALQRFSIKVSDLTVPLEYINAHPRVKCFGVVKILPDIYLPDPLKCTNMGSTIRFRDNTSMQCMYKRFQAATTPWPAHIYESYNIANILQKARTQLAQHKIDTMPSDPIQLSYWLVRNLHLSEELVKSVFLANTVNTRLKLIASTFKKETIFSCRNCVSHVADCRELFAMSKHGVQSQYCNSAGYIHETNTVYEVNRQNILYSGSPSTQFSWFPGYKWHIIVCKICKHHLGWQFTAVETNLIPKQFFGISSSSVRVRLARDRNDVPAQNVAYINFLHFMNAGMNELREIRNNMPHI